MSDSRTMSALEKMTSIKGDREIRTGWHSTALIVEALVLLIVVVSCMAIFARLFGFAYASNAYDQHRAHAITLATSQAERIAAATDIATGTFVEEDGEFTTTCVITERDTARGKIYDAVISVRDQDDDLFEVTTSRYFKSQSALSPTPTAPAGATGTDQGQASGTGNAGSTADPNASANDNANGSAQAAGTAQAANSGASAEGTAANTTKTGGE